MYFTFDKSFDMKLDSDARNDSYLLNIMIINGVDPYTLKENDFSEDTSILPPLVSGLYMRICSVYSYLIHVIKYSATYLR